MFWACQMLITELSLSVFITVSQLWAAQKLKDASPNLVLALRTSRITGTTSIFAGGHKR